MHDNSLLLRSMMKALNSTAALSSFHWVLSDDRKGQIRRGDHCSNIKHITNKRLTDSTVKMRLERTNLQTDIQLHMDNLLSS